MLDRNVDAISSSVAEKTECACDGRSMLTKRAQREAGARPGSEVGVPVTSIDFSGVR